MKELKYFAPPFLILALSGVVVFSSANTDTPAELQEAYKAKTGKYLQVQQGNRLPEYERGDVRTKLGKTLPDNTRVDIYESPQGAGFQVITEDANGVYSVGYGPEAESRTWTRIKEQPVASST